VGVGQVTSLPHGTTKPETTGKSHNQCPYQPTFLNTLQSAVVNMPVHLRKCVENARAHIEF
jgi:hypothetical protein